MKRFLVVMLVMMFAFVGLVGCGSTDGVTEEPDIQEVEEIEEAPEETITESEDVEAVEEEEEQEEQEEQEEEEQEESRELETVSGAEDLIGSWIWNGQLAYLYIFEDNGIGIRGFICDGEAGFEPELDNFQWEIVNGTLELDFGGRNVELWDLYYTGDTFTIVSQIIVGEEHTYVRLLEEVPDYLVGVWNWEEDRSWSYEFYDDGTGSRPGFPFGRDSFEWAITVDGGLIMNMEGGMVEMWSYVIRGRDIVLTITSRQVVGMEYSYYLDGGTRGR